MSSPVEGKPYRLVKWCIEHDTEATMEGECATGWFDNQRHHNDPRYMKGNPCDIYTMQLRIHGYRRVPGFDKEWGQ